MGFSVKESKSSKHSLCVRDFKFFDRFDFIIRET